MKIFLFALKFTGKPILAVLLCFILFFVPSIAQEKPVREPAYKSKSKSFRGKVFYGLASFYANKFNGRRTSSGQFFSQTKYTCACNMLPFGTWVRVTNIRNGRSAIVVVNDRLHPKMRRIADLSTAAAKKLGYMSHGITRIKMEVLGKEKPL